MVLGTLGSIAVYLFTKKVGAEARRGWNLLPVVVANQDIRAGSSITLDMIAQRSVPEQFVTNSVIAPEQASQILDRKIVASVLTGDVLLWSQFEAEDQQQVLFATRDIPAGAVIAQADVRDGELPKKLHTFSYVGPADRPQIVGRHPVAAFRAGDPILWTHFQAEPAPIRPASAK